jgi:RNA polymerase sigma-70 factor (ECF subfamily)
MVSERAAEQEQRWSAWMRSAQAGDRLAYTRLLSAVTPFVRSLARRYGGPTDAAEDVVQEVLLTVHRVRHTWDPTRPFSPWLAAIAARRSIDILRRSARIARHEQTDDLAYETFADPAANNETGALHAAVEIEPLLAALPPKQLAALEALKLQGLSLKEAAVASGQSVAALKVNMHRAVKTLQRLVRKSESGSEPQ